MARRIRSPFLVAYTGLVFLFVFLPILTAAVFSFNADRFPGLPWAGFTTDWYVAVLKDGTMQRALLRTLVVAGVAAPLATILGFAAAYVTYSFRFPGVGLYALLIGLPPAVPLVVLGVAMLTFLSRIGMTGTLTGIIAAHVVLCIPFAMALVRMRLSDMDRDIEAAAWNLGASRWAGLRDVIMPFCRPALVASLFLTAAVSFDEFMVAWFISGLNETLPVRLLVLLQSGQVSPKINAAGTLVFGVSIVLVVVAQLLLAASGRAARARTQRAAP